MSTTRILDMTAGWRGTWFEIGDAVLLDRRAECEPDVVADWKALPFRDGSFDMVVFDPPHHNLGTGFLAESYGTCTTAQLMFDILHGSREARRVVRPGGWMALKWATRHIGLQRVLSHMPGWRPRFGQRTTGRGYQKDSTYWCMLEREN